LSARRALWKETKSVLPQLLRTKWNCLVAKPFDF
jgi:hypothetical protein